MTNKEFIQDLQSSKYYTKLFDMYNVVMIMLVGSRKLNITDERSDYDIIVLTTNSITKFPEECLMYYGKKVHWEYININNFVQELNPNRLLDIIMNMTMKYTDNSNIIYTNDNYKHIIDYLINNKEKISRLGCINLYKSMQEFVNKILNNNEIKQELYTKFIYHLCCASYILLDEIFDIDFLKNIKRIRWQPVSEAHKQLAVERIRLANEYIDTLSIDIEYELKNLRNELNSLYN